MNSLGYRAIGKEHHKHLFEFLHEAGVDGELISYFDCVRKRRNDFLYRDVEKTSRKEAEEILRKAGPMKKWLQSSYPSMAAYLEGVLQSQEELYKVLAMEETAQGG